MKGDHFYWKKEYQARGSPHYQVLLWIWNASVIGQDKPGEILAWLQARITCRIPNEKSDANLHRLITRYQLHKCSAYCNWRWRCGSTFITRCRFGLIPSPSLTKRLFTLFGHVPYNHFLVVLSTLPSWDPAVVSSVTIAAQHYALSHSYTLENNSLICLCLYPSLKR